jgi:hypothetical protein
MPCLLLLPVLATSFLCLRLPLAPDGHYQLVSGTAHTQYTQNLSDPDHADFAASGPGV